MSTRCQVKIQGTDFEPKEAVTLYHHCDGYPSNMVPLLAGAYKPNWQHGRVGKVASYVVAEDVVGFDIEDSHDLHGDIDWYYIIKVSSKGDVTDIPKWTLEVYDVLYYSDSIKDMRKVFDGPIQDAVKLADSMEVQEDEE